jgi:hypothetical protein
MIGSAVEINSIVVSVRCVYRKIAELYVLFAASKVDTVRA